MITATAPLLITKSKFLKPDAEFVTTCFVAWNDVAEMLGLDEFADYTDPTKPPAKDIVNAAFIEAREWCNKYKQVHGKDPSDKDALEVENDILNSIQEHWSAANILMTQLSLDKYVGDLNKWCKGGAIRKYLFGVPPIPGHGLEYFVTPIGISFTAYTPFMIPYIELYYDENESLPEWDIEDIHAYDIIETLYRHRDSLNDPIQFDLNMWDADREIVVHE